MRARKGTLVSCAAQLPQDAGQLTNRVPPSLPPSSTLPSPAASPQVRVALRAAFGNPDRAVDYLMNGIPAAATAAANRRAAGPAAAAAPSGAASGPLDVLRSHPQFAQLKMLVQSNPAALPQVLAQIGAASPDLLALINANKDAFIAMMNEPLTEEEEGEGEEGDEEMGDEEGEEGDEGEEGMPGQMAQLLAMVAGMPPEQRAAMAAQIGIPPAQLEQLAQAAAAGGMGGGGPGTTVVRLTADEAAAVDRLCAMGFERNTVLQAYLACDKNEELAANMLLEGVSEDSRNERHSRACACRWARMALAHTTRTHSHCLLPPSSP